jgi:two-component system CheB/CheR fusion protein
MSRPDALPPKRRADARSDVALWRLASIVQSTGDAVVSVTRDRIVTSWNRGAEKVYGYTAEEVLGRPIQVTIPPRYAEETRQMTERVLRGEAVEQFETERVRKDGSIVPVAVTVSPIIDAFGEVVGIASIARDISERRRAETRQKLLLDELNHRVKNTLATVQSIAMLSAGGAESLESFREAFEGRLLALSRVHEVLTRSAWQDAALRVLLEQTLAPYSGSRAGRVAFAGPEVRLAPNAAVALTMAFHELATNAVKYGALSVPEGRVTVSWQTDTDAAEDGVAITWRESGGPPVLPPRRRGFGSRLIERGLAQELEARLRLDFLPSGLECSMSLPLSCKASAE